MLSVSFTYLFIFMFPWDYIGCLFTALYPPSISGSHVLRNRYTYMFESLGKAIVYKVSSAHIFTVLFIAFLNHMIASKS